MNILCKKINTLKKFLALFFIIFGILPGVLQAAGISVSYPGYPGPIFSESNLAPGAKIEKTASVTNTEATTQKFAFKITSGPKSNLKNHIYLSVKIGSTNLIGPKKISDFYGFLNETEVDEILPGETKNYNFVAELDREIGNEFQGKSESFDLNLGFVSRIAPPESPESPPNILTPIINFLTTPIFETESPEIQGVKSGDSLSKSEEEGVKGEIEGRVVCPWWWIALLILIISLGIVYLNYSIRIKPRLIWAWPIALGGLAWILHWWFHRYFDESIWCDRLWWLEIIVISLLTIGYLFLRKKHKKDE